MSLRHGLAGLALAATAALSAQTAQAIEVPAAFGSTNVQARTPDPDTGQWIQLAWDLQHFTGDDLSSTFSDFGASASTTLWPGPPQLLTANAFSSDRNTLVDAGSVLAYYMAVSGPADGYVPVRMQALLEGGHTGPSAFGGEGGAYLLIFREVGNVPIYNRYLFTQEDHDAFTVDTTFLFQANEIYRIGLAAGASARGVGLEEDGSDFSGYGDASSAPTFSYGSADPYFSIDPDFLSGNPGYSLQFSAGIGNEPSPWMIDGPGGVPEPASWMLMIGGFGLAGVALRRRRRASADA